MHFRRYIAGIATVLMSEKYQRIGDHLASTVVVSAIEEKVDREEPVGATSTARSKSSLLDMNDTQRRIVGIVILVAGLAIMLKIMDWVVVSAYLGPLEKAIQFQTTWIVWVIGAAVIGGIEYYLFSDQ